jgi:transcription elongation factor Elf1
MKNIETTIACPKCKKSMSVMLTEVKAGYTKLCRNCGTQINLSGADLGKVQGVLNELDALGPGVNVKVKVKSKRPWWRFWSWK